MEINNVVTDNMRVAIIAASLKQRLNLKSILESNQIQVVSEDELKKYLAKPNGEQIADVLLVDLDETDEAENTPLEVFMESTTLPILFNDSSSTKNIYSNGGLAWGKRLAGKLVELARKHSVGRVIDRTLFDESGEPAERAADTDLEKIKACGTSIATDVKSAKKNTSANALAIDSDKGGKVGSLQNQPSASVDSKKSSKIKSRVARKQPEEAERVWVLGASIGGPEAVKEFVSGLPHGLPMAFVLVQHIGSNFVPVLAEQLNRVTGLKVRTPENGMRLKHGEIVVSPVKNRLVFSRYGSIAISTVTRKTTYSPSIDEALSEVAKRYQDKAGAIIFSGMGNDGQRGVREIVNNGGTVWAQEKDSCVISSMADSARKTGCVDFSASPSKLAQHLIKYLQNI